MQARVRSRQETVNKRFKDWGILRQVYRHDIPSHGVVFRAVAVVTQLSISNGKYLFQCGYHDPSYSSSEGMDGSINNGEAKGTHSDISYDKESNDENCRGCSPSNDNVHSRCILSEFNICYYVF